MESTSELPPFLGQQQPSNDADTPDLSFLGSPPSTPPASSPSPEPTMSSAPQPAEVSSEPQPSISRPSSGSGLEVLSGVLRVIERIRNHATDAVHTKVQPDGTCIFFKKVKSSAGVERWERALTIRCPDCNDTLLRFGFYREHGDWVTASGWCDCTRTNERNEEYRHKALHAKVQEKHPFTPGFFEDGIVSSDVPWWRDLFPVLAHGNFTGPEVEEVHQYYTLPEWIRDRGNYGKRPDKLLDRFDAADESYAKSWGGRLAAAGVRSSRLPYKDA